MKFSEWSYQRIDIAQFLKEAETLIEAFEKASNAQEQISLWEKLNKKFDEVSRESTICSIRTSINALDEFYDQEHQFWMEQEAPLSQLADRFNKALLASPFRAQLVEVYGDLVFKMAEQKSKIFDASIMEDLVEESKLSNESSKISAVAEVEFRGEKYTLPQMDKFLNSKDEAERKEAYKVCTDFYESKEAEYDDVYDKLVKVRHKMAKKLGYENFVDLAYDRMGRLDYGPKDVAKYREMIVKYIVPASQHLVERQLKRIGKEKMTFVDEKLDFVTGNPTPKGTEEELVQAAAKMYKELSKETHAFFKMMTEEGLLDLSSKKGKRGGGYCTYIPIENKPFIFANFNETAHDVDVLTHEAGHAFQVYSSRNLPLADYRWPTMEACEIHSMSMEFFAWPWMESFFKEDTQKYYFAHLSRALRFLPYGALVDHFQEEVYLHPEMSKEERKATFRRLEKIYLPHRSYEGLEFLEKGTFWYRQGHIFQAPFYYIDYTLAQVCALQYWVRDRENHAEAWASYLALCQLGGSQSFLSLVKSASLQNPFEEDCIPSILSKAMAFLDQVDDSSF